MRAIMRVLTVALLLGAALTACSESPTAPVTKPGTSGSNTKPPEPARLYATGEVVFPDFDSDSLPMSFMHVTVSVEIINRTFGTSFGGTNSLIGIEFAPLCATVNGQETCTPRSLWYDSPGDREDPYRGLTLGRGKVYGQGEDGSEWLLDLDTYRVNGNSLWMGYINLAMKRTKVGSTPFRRSGWGINLTFNQTAP